MKYVNGKAADVKLKKFSVLWEFIFICWFVYDSVFEYVLQTKGTWDDCFYREELLL